MGDSLLGLQFSAWSVVGTGGLQWPGPGQLYPSLPNHPETNNVTAWCKKRQGISQQLLVSSLYVLVSSLQCLDSTVQSFVKCLAPGLQCVVPRLWSLVSGLQCHVYSLFSLQSLASTCCTGGCLSRTKYILIPRYLCKGRLKQCRPHLEECKT